MNIILSSKLKRGSELELKLAEAGESWKMSHGQMWNCEEEDALINLESDYIAEGISVFRPGQLTIWDFFFIKLFLFLVRVTLPRAAPVVTV